MMTILYVAIADGTPGLRQHSCEPGSAAQPRALTCRGLEGAALQVLMRPNPGPGHGAALWATCIVRRKTRAEPCFSEMIGTNESAVWIPEGLNLVSSLAVRTFQLCLVSAPYSTKTKASAHPARLRRWEATCQRSATPSP
ncbi:uncharacterized protein LOC122202411 [Panthera leo]|uniref:uncharacterized protein LOC122202411 n=1 Tax=Panthera leo TaxID=9689 RepID=UPI001C69E7EB|nr:uncharacterized protein LOC122202411 [Panthera leo]